MGKKGYNSEEYEKLIDMKKVPILPLDNRWHTLFPNDQKPSRIKKLERDVLDLLKKESNVGQQLKELDKLKKKLMQEIVQNMEETDEENEKLRQKKLLASRKLIDDINGKVHNLENEKYALPYKLMEKNKELLLESIDICYDRIRENKEQIQVLESWIERTRIELKKNVVIKQEMEERTSNIYSYMHDMLGPQFMEVFDNGHQ